MVLANIKVGDQVEFKVIEGDKRIIVGAKVLTAVATSKPAEKPPVVVVEPPKETPKPVTPPAKPPPAGTTGTFVGVVMETGDKYVWVKADDGALEQFVPRWVGGTPAEGGGPDENAIKAIKGLKVDQKVAVKWILEERKRIVSIEPSR